MNKREVCCPKEFVVRGPNPRFSGSVALFLLMALPAGTFAQASGNKDKSRLDLHLGERFRLFREIESSLETGRNGGPRSGIDEDKLDIHRAFVDLGIWKSERNSVSLRIGRQEMSLGSSSLVATRDGRNIRRSFDGFRLTADVAHWTVDGSLCDRPRRTRTCSTTQSITRRASVDSTVCMLFRSCLASTSICTTWDRTTSWTNM
jgi:hypothetical protein